jgi:uncharacterized membrane protein
MSNGKTNLGVEPNVGGLLCYAPCCIGLVFSIVAAIVEKESRFVRFHAFQSLLVHGVLMVVGVGFQVATIEVSMLAAPLGMIVSLLGIPLGLGGLVLLVLLMVKAYQNEEWALPTLGELARKWV